MSDRPFAERIAAAKPELWERFLRAVERERREAVMRRERELYGRPLRFLSIEEAGELRVVA